MRNDKEIVLNLRKQGKSYNEISALMKVPKSTLSAWLKNLQWSQSIAVKLRNEATIKHIIRLEALHKIRGKHLKMVYEKAELEALDDFEQLKYHPLFVAAIMLYWGEGDKLSKYRVSISNSESALLEIFVFFLKNMCNIKEQKIKAWILAYPNMDILKTRTFWADGTGLPEENFKKTIIIAGKLKSRKLPNGVCTVTVMSSYLKRKMLIWLRCFSSELVKSSYYAGMV